VQSDKGLTNTPASICFSYQEILTNTLAGSCSLDGWLLLSAFSTWVAVNVRAAACSPATPTCVDSWQARRADRAWLICWSILSGSTSVRFASEHAFASQAACQRASGAPLERARLQEALQLQELALPEAVLRVLCLGALLRWLQLRQLLQQPRERERAPGSGGGHPGAQPQRFSPQDPAGDGAAPGHRD
jgi:hypothetical protein